MTPLEAYKLDGTFRELIEQWCEHDECPIPLVDRCLELDMPLAAAASRWAAYGPYRQVCNSDNILKRPTPGLHAGMQFWWHQTKDYPGNLNPQAHVIPHGHIDVSALTEKFPKRFTNGVYVSKYKIDCILWLLTNWVKEEYLHDN